MLDQIIGESWVPVIGDEFSKEYMQKLSTWLAYQRQSETIYPDSENVFRALKLCPFNQTRVIILGQDPYYNGVADGLCFSYKEGIKAGIGINQSLDVILHEIENDVYNGFNVNYDYDLSYLAKQGVLLLNTVLTVKRGNPNSHANLGWERLTSVILYKLIHDTSPKAFLLWGAHANATFNNVVKKYNQDYMSWQYTNHIRLEAPHPAADLYRKDSFGNIPNDYPGSFTGCKHFSQVNEFLMSKSQDPINWFNVSEPYFNKDFVKEFCPI